MIKMMKYQVLNKKEEDAVVIKIIDRLLDPFLPFSGQHRKEEWERGWQENVKSGDITPRYFGKYNVHRLNGQFISTKHPNYEQEMLYTIVDELSLKYLKDATSIYEFGCGTGHNLLRIREINKDAVIYGCDWTVSSNELVKKLGFNALNFDYFNPPLQKMMPNS